ncbi:MAG: HAD-IA family hydrolase [Anaerolineales bacterium]|nr:HAD-IA family hydrolase [Anaerolineales bacterium]
MFKLEPHIQALIFDCDGTLADTMPLHYLAWQQTLQAVGGQFPEKLFYELGGASNDRIVATLNQTFSYQFDAKLLSHEKDERYLKLVPQAKPIEAVVAIARQYKGRLPLAVATGGTPTLVKTTLQAIGLFDFFDTIVTSHDVAHAKPAPDTFLECARRMHVAPELCHVFEDADFGIEGAQRAGMSVTDIRPWRS